MTAERRRFSTTNVGMPLPLGQIPVVGESDFRRELLERVAGGERVIAFFGEESGPSSAVRLCAVLADDGANCLHVGRMAVEGGQFASLTPECPQVHLFEREIAEQHGLVPTGHPWLKPVRYHRSWSGNDAWNRPAAEPILPAVGDFFRVEGDQILKMIFFDKVDDFLVICGRGDRPAEKEPERVLRLCRDK